MTPHRPVLVSACTLLCACWLPGAAGPLAPHLFRARLAQSSAPCNHSRPCKRRCFRSRRQTRASTGTQTMSNHRLPLQAGPHASLSSPADLPRTQLWPAVIACASTALEPAALPRRGPAAWAPVGRCACHATPLLRPTPWMAAALALQNRCWCACRVWQRSAQHPTMQHGAPACAR